MFIALWFFLVAAGSAGAATKDCTDLMQHLYIPQDRLGMEAIQYLIPMSQQKQVTCLIKKNFYFSTFSRC